MIEFINVHKVYPGNNSALDGVSFHIPNGGIGFLTGHSGAGKSTLLKLTAALETPSQGNIVLGGAPLNSLSEKQKPKLRQRMGIVFQNHHLLLDRNVFDNVALPLVFAGYTYSDIQRRVRAALDKVGLLSRAKENPVSLSGGEQQRVGIARAVVNRPRLLLADEPTGNLDPEMSMEIMDLFRKFNQVGVTVLIATHDLALLREMGFPLLSLRAGKIIHNDFQNPRMEN